MGIRSFKELIDAVIQAVGANISGVWTLNGIRYEIAFMSLFDMKAELAGQSLSGEKGIEVLGLEIVGGLPSASDLSDLISALSHYGWRKCDASIREGDYRKFFFTY